MSFLSSDTLSIVKRSLIPSLAHKTLFKKRLRELWQLRMQAGAIALVIVGGVSIFIMSLSTLDSLSTTQQSYYRDYRFAEVFASLKRAPLRLTQRIQEIPGVEQVETRVVTYVNIDVAGFNEPVSGHLISLPASTSAGASPSRSRSLNEIFLRAGSVPAPDADDQLVVSEKFALAHSLGVGDSLQIVINGRRKSFHIVGLAMSPEYIFQIAPGAMFPDYQRYGVLWMARRPLASASDLEGAFNDVSMTLARDVAPRTVIDRLDELLANYGGAGAYARKDQLSNRFLTEELNQQRTLAMVFPAVFLGVAAFLLNLVISRLIELQREQIATLKAFGYNNLDVVIHYLQLAMLMLVPGLIGGVLAGAWMGLGMTGIYEELYSLPYVDFILRPRVIAGAVLISVLAALVGTVFSVHRAVAEPPAQAMRPAPPVMYRRSVIERLGLAAWLSPSLRMISRHIERNLLKSFLSVLGIALAGGVLMMGGFQRGAIDHMVDVQFRLSQREDLQVVFNEPTSRRALYAMQSLPGVIHAEGFRRVPVRLRLAHRDYRTALQGLDRDGSLVNLLDADLQPITLPEEGLVLTDYLAGILHARVGDVLEVELLEGQRWKRSVTLAATAKEYVGVNAYMQRDALNRLLREGSALSGVLLAVDPLQANGLSRTLKAMPRVAGVINQDSAVKSFYSTMAEVILFFTFISTLLGMFIAFGVVYNSMRINLSERTRDMASLRVLGFRVREVAWLLLGEMALFVYLAIPLGLLIGVGYCVYLASRFDTDLYRVPLVLEPQVYAFSALVVVVSSVMSAVLIARRLNRLDMIAVLKTRE